MLGNPRAFLLARLVCPLDPRLLPSLLSSLSSDQHVRGRYFHSRQPMDAPPSAETAPPRTLAPPVPTVSISPAAATDASPPVTPPGSPSTTTTRRGAHLTNLTPPPPRTAAGLNHESDSGSIATTSAPPSPSSHYLTSLSLRDNTDVSLLFLRPPYEALLVRGARGRWKKKDVVFRPFLGSLGASSIYCRHFEPPPPILHTLASLV